MRKLALAALFAASAGCVASTDDDGDGVDNDFDFCPNTPSGAVVDEDGCAIATAPVRMTANWSFKQLSNGASLGCPTGFNTTAVHAIPVNRFGDKNGTEEIDLYTCSALTGTSDQYMPRLYEVYLEITTQNNSALYADTPSAYVDLTLVDKTITQTIIDDGGFFKFNFELRDAGNGAKLTCAQAGSDGVEILSTLNGSTQAKSDIFNCVTPGFRDDGTGPGFTAGLLAGDYTVSIAALDASDRSVGTAPALTNKRVAAPNKITDLGLIQIPID